MYYSIIILSTDGLRGMRQRRRTPPQRSVECASAYARTFRIGRQLSNLLGTHGAVALRADKDDGTSAVVQQRRTIESTPCPQ